MKNKTLIYIVIIAVLVIGGFYLLNDHIYNEKQADYVEGDIVEKEGKVLAVDLEKVTFDGPVLITLEGSGEVYTIAIPSMGLPLCPAYQAKNIADVYLLKNGDSISVRGQISEDGSIVPCESADHYLRKK